MRNAPAESQGRWNTHSRRLLAALTMAVARYL
jgi:hypothetical protein